MIWVKKDGTKIHLSDHATNTLSKIFGKSQMSVADQDLVVQALKEHGDPTIVYDIFEDRMKGAEPEPDTNDEF